MHKLLETWILYYDSPHFYSTYEETTKKYCKIRKIYEIDSIEKFWRVMNNALSIDEMQHGCAFLFYKNELNVEKCGVGNAKFTISVEELYENNITINNIWEDILLLLIGGSFYNEVINGVSILCERFHYIVSINVNTNNSDEYSQIIIDLAKKVEEYVLNNDEQNINVHISSNISFELNI